ncbi:4-hydroxy-tetrahydrodipicolinate synthase [Cohaesibacter sp. ES.047]|uniref:4-hydroxy-tetrahydrodipicolinate synthase n=1 Tax=Cohaesibacter sp. ES.047 TaxID=1798205 RepID=UPI000BB68E38|nr:4-hydroxy-tetrahydrodipicolinate synthase [Cohaesibacter sp. ES.047]SNY93604.1 4-hydroxy-tetrahydrodipicolinate synthase [Cohaesibacter sp. ES.047]
MSITKADITGLFTAIVTPFKDDKSVDHDALKALVKRQLAAGATGIVPIGGTGEYPSLSRAERGEVVASCVEAAGDAPVMPGVLSTGYYDALDAGHDFKQAGAAGLMLVTPYYAVGPQDGMRRYFNNYREAIDLPLLAYEIPRRTGAALSPDTYRALADDGAIIGMKYSNYDMPQFIASLRESGDKLAILSGEEPLFATHIAQGAVGGVLASASIYPEYWLKIFELAKGGDLKAALALQNKIDPVLSAIYAETNPGPLKKYMSLAGADVGGVRLPLCDPSEETLAMLRAALDGFNGDLEA